MLHQRLLSGYFRTRFGGQILWTLVSVEPVEQDYQQNVAKTIMTVTVDTIHYVSYDVKSLHIELRAHRLVS